MKTYTIVEFPAVQYLMEYAWFKTECHLINDELGMQLYGSSAYFVPTHRLEEVYPQETAF